MHVVRAAFLLVLGVSLAHAQPAPPPSSTLEPALATIAPPAGWARIADPRVAWRSLAGVAVFAEAQPGSCLARGGYHDPRWPDYYRVAAGSHGALELCLQLPGQAVAVTATHAHDAAVVTVIGAIAERLRPPVAVPIVDVAIRPRLAVVATEDGFTIHGLARPTRVTLTAALGSCATLPPGRAAALTTPIAPLRGERWAGRPRGDARTAAYCLERRTDAIEVLVDEPVVSAAAPGVLEPELAAVLAALHDAVAAGADAPHWFGVAADEIDLPHTGITLRARHQLDAGWVVADDARQRWKRVAGDGWSEPDTDLLLPTQRARYAIGFRPEPCLRGDGARSPRDVALFPDGLGAATTSGNGATLRLSACAVGVGASFAVIVLVLDDDAPDNARDVRAIATSFARSAGLTVRGMPLRLETFSLVTVPVLWTDDQPTQWGVLLRARYQATWGRPLGLVGMGEVAVGGATDDFHPGLEDDPEATRGDFLGELRGGLGLAYSAGPITVEGLGTAAVHDLWPDASWLELSVGAGVHLGSAQVKLRYVRGITEPANAAEVVVLARPAAVFVKLIDFGRAAARRGVEVGVGVTF